MLTKRIIPCLGVDKGRVVKGVNFLNLRDPGDQVEIARRYDALAGSIFHFGTFTIAEVKEYLASRGVPVRLIAAGDPAAAK